MKPRKPRKPLILTDEQRSMIASTLIAGRVGSQFSLCCSEDTVCEAIVGKRFAHALRSYAYENLGCSSFGDNRYEADFVQRYLDKIANLETLERG